MTWLRRVLAATRAGTTGRELALASAGATLYAALAAVPWALVAVALARLLLGRDRLVRHGERLATTLPDTLGAGHAVFALLSSGLALSPLAVGFAVVMGSAYGDGLSRALVRFAPAGQQDRRPRWWVRLATLPLLGLAPLMLTGLLLVTPTLSHLKDQHGLGGLLGASYLSLNIVWMITWLPLTWAFRVVAPGRPRWRSALIGGVVTGAFVSGFLQGFLLFLSLPVDLGRPFGGLAAVGTVTSLLLWLWVLHLVVCIGYAFTWAVDGSRRARPRADPGGGLASDGWGAGAPVPKDQPEGSLATTGISSVSTPSTAASSGLCTRIPPM